MTYQRKEIIGNATLYLGDCREVLPDLSKADLLLTDPPYGIALNTDNSRFTGGNVASAKKRGNNVGSANGKPIANDAKPFDPTFLLSLADVQIIWGWNNYPDLLPRGACLVWLKRNDDAFGSFLSDAELAWMSKGHGVYCKRDLSNAGITRERVHPTQKPVPLMEWCLSFAPKSQTVLDPYMGSGSTGVAVIKAGKAFTGIELDAGYFDAACKRIEQVQRQGNLFAA